MKIGIFDSGLGGLSVLHHAMKVLPHAHYIYYADEDHVPYGEKSKEEIKGYVKEIIDFFIEQDVDAIVIACNTATSVATHQFRQTYPIPIIGMEPAVKKAVELYGDKERIMVAATPLTIKGDKLYHLVEKVDKNHCVDFIALPGLVRFAEKGIFEGKEVEDYLKEMFKIYDLYDYSTIVLGCTHFNYFKQSFLNVFSRDIHFVDGNEGTINHLKKILADKKECELKVDYYFSKRKINKNEENKIKTYLKQLDKEYKK